MKARLFGISLAALLAACSTQHAELQIQPVGEESGRPDDGSFAKAQILLSRGEYSLAIDAYRKAVRHDPANGAAYNGLAISYDGVGRFDLSRRYYELALARAPREGKYYRNLALSLKRQGKGEEAAHVLAQMEAATATRTAAAMPPQPALRTLAAIARDGLTSVAGAATDAIRPHLERLSMGEVLLSTAGPAQSVRAARSITVEIPVVEMRKPAKDIPLVPELAARPVGPSITIALPEADPIVQDDPAVEFAALPAADMPLTELEHSKAALLPTEPEPAELLAALHPAAAPAHVCDTPASAAGFEAASMGDAGLALFLGDFAPARLGQGGSIDLPLIYRTSADLPQPVPSQAARTMACPLHMADNPAGFDALFSLLWLDGGNVA